MRRSSFVLANLSLCERTLFIRVARLDVSESIVAPLLRRHRAHMLLRDIEHFVNVATSCTATPLCIEWIFVRGVRAWAR
jgi:hypothetical protein